MALAAVIAVAVRLPTLCRDCFDLAEAPDNRRVCTTCGSRRLVRHAELATLAIAHIDCDAFFASVEKRDRPELADRPVIVGGGRRGVVAAACYVARLSGVRSAMPMFRARTLCPEAVVIAPNFAKYSAAAREIRTRLQALTPLVEPLSIDEAVLCLSDAATRHGAPAAVVLARFVRAIEIELGLTISVGLAPNRLLAKLAAGRDKPRGFAVIGSAEARAVLGPMPVRALPGVGPVRERQLAALGIIRLADLQGLAPSAARSLGRDGPGLVRRACGEDQRPVCAVRETRSISAETTFEGDVADLPELLRPLRRLSERVAARLREKGLAAGGMVLKLRTSGFATRTRHLTFAVPTARAEQVFAAASSLLGREVDGETHFRLIGVGAEPLVAAAVAEGGDLAAPAATLTRTLP